MIRAIEHTISADSKFSAVVVCVALFMPTQVFAQNSEARSITEEARRNQARRQQEERQKVEAFRQSQRPAPIAPDLTNSAGTMAMGASELCARTEEVPPAPAPSQSQAPTVRARETTLINSVNIQGMTRYPASAFASEIAEISGKQVTIEDVDKVLRTITNRYINDGYVTSRALVGPGSLKEGALTIAVFEDRADQLRGGHFGDGRKFQKSVLRMAFPSMKGKLVNIRDLEQGLDQLSRLTSSKSTIDIRPGAVPGTSAIVICKERISRPIHLIADFDNDGQSNTGRYQATGTVVLDSPLGMGEVWQGYYSHNLGGRKNVGSEGYGVFVSVPLGYTTFTLSGGRYRFHSVLEGNDFAFENAGESINGSASIEHLLFRNQRTKVSAGMSISLLDTTNRIQGIELLTGSYRLVSGSLQVHYYQLFGLKKSTLLKQNRTSVLTVNVNYNHGLNILGANGIDIGPGGPRVTFRKLDSTLSYQTGLRIIGLQLTYAGLVRGQIAFTNLFPAERLSIGSSSTVRGFRDDGISGRSGFFTRQQLNIPLGSLGLLANGLGSTGISTFVAYDAGGILPDADDAFERGFVQSVSVGLRGQNQYMTGEFTVNKTLSSPQFVRASEFQFVGSVRFTF